eukprot:1143766-Pelagomonas_calceolata.AAC.1
MNHDGVFIMTSPTNTKEDSSDGLHAAAVPLPTASDAQGVNIESCQIWHPSATILPTGFFLEVPAKALLGQTLPPWTLAAQIVLFYRTCRLLNSIVVLNKKIPKSIFPRGFPVKQRLASSRPDAML